jgi:DNA-binding NarL/FixJ family response regulator
MLRSGLAQLINRQPDLIVCGQAANGAQASSRLEKLRPDLLLTDLMMPGRNGIEWIKEVLAAHPNLPVLVISMHDETVYAPRVLRAGARGYIMKDASGAELLEAIRRVADGRVSVSRSMSAKILELFSGHNPRGSHSPIDKLSAREFEIFQLIGLGKGTCEIAKQLRISPKTVDVHRGHIREKLSLKDANALMHHAVRWVETERPNA